MTSMQPEPLPLAARLRSNLLRAPSFFLSTGLFGSLSLLVSCFETDGGLQHRIARSWAHVSLFLAGAPVEVVGRENLRPLAIYAANHTSFMDTPVIFASLPFSFDLGQAEFVEMAVHRLASQPLRPDSCQ